MCTRSVWIIFFWFKSARGLWDFAVSNTPSDGFLHKVSQELFHPLISSVPPPCISSWTFLFQSIIRAWLGPYWVVSVQSGAIVTSHNTQSLMASLCPTPSDAPLVFDHALSTPTCFHSLLTVIWGAWLKRNLRSSAHLVILPKWSNVWDNVMRS